MVKVGRLLKGTSMAFDIPEKSVALSTRIIRENGLLTTGARGVNAPDMTFLDAARMMLGYLFTDKPGMMANAVRYFGGMTLEYRHDPDGPTLDEEDAAIRQWAEAEAPAGLAVPDLGFLDRLESPVTFEVAFAAVLQELADPQKREFYLWGGIDIIGRERDQTATISLPGPKHYEFSPDSTFSILWQNTPDLAALMDPSGRLKPSPASTMAALGVMSDPSRKATPSIKVDRIFDADVLAVVAQLFQHEENDDVR